MAAFDDTRECYGDDLLCYEKESFQWTMQSKRLRRF